MEKGDPLSVGRHATENTQALFHTVQTTAAKKKKKIVSVNISS